MYREYTYIQTDIHLFYYIDLLIITKTAKVVYTHSSDAKAETMASVSIEPRDVESDKLQVAYRIRRKTGSH